MEAFPNIAPTSSLIQGSKVQSKDYFSVNILHRWITVISLDPLKFCAISESFSLDFVNFYEKLQFLVTVLQGQYILEIQFTLRPTCYDKFGVLLGAGKLFGCNWEPMGTQKTLSECYKFLWNILQFQLQFAVDRFLFMLIFCVLWYVSIKYVFLSQISDKSFL